MTQARLALLFLTVSGFTAVGGCRRASRGVEAPPALRSIRGCRYVVEEFTREPLELDVTASCEGPNITGFSRTDPAAAPFITLFDASAELRAIPGGWQFAEPRGEARVRYHVDLEGMARAAHRFDAALRIGHSLIAPASAFLLEPEPLELGTPIDVEMRLPAGEDFESGLTQVGARSERHYRLQAEQVTVATYSIFGRSQRAAVNVGGAAIDIVTADGALALPRDSTTRWVADSARAVTAFFGRFPAPHVLVLLLPVADRREVLFGKLLPQSSPAVAVLLGEHTSESALRRDWVLVHELFHLGFPSFHEEAKWLDEGTATYFEPIIRARAGGLSELEVWTEFARDMPQGLAAIEERGLEHPSSDREVYWGGAIACLLADVTSRQRSNGAVGLEAGLRAVLRAGGDATKVWSATDVGRVVDDALGSPILSDIMAKHAYAAEPVGLPGLFRELGVIQHPNGSITLDDRAKLARIRHAITFGR